MTTERVWQGLALIAVLGWAGTAGAWWMSAGAPDAPLIAKASPEAERRGARRAQRRPARNRAEVRSERTAPVASAGQPMVPEELRVQLRDEVEQELREERQERRTQRHEERLVRMLDHAADFVEENELGPDVQAKLEAAMVAMHDRMEVLHQDRDGEGPPDEDHRDQMRASFDQMHTEVAGILGEELADVFRDEMRGGRRGPPR